ncbi:type III pantothenate kinase [Methylobacillus arboreus]|uniref:type III pantothenate kinase n=1 Tax=Methylobacillus arboreus TaxID=755170 RepID=UPI001E486432|nr:type III pantothenate kinase [Methylobacillus arboreus]MCB5189127.1 type III pantothenate kinase [Methylobacillus arboreus]
MSRLLAIDVGNSRTKWAVLERETGEILTRGVLEDEEETPASWQACDRAAIANVAGKERHAALNQRLLPLGLPVRWHLSSFQACGLSNGYDVPEQLGIDRWAAMVATWQYYQRSCLVVNAGTALTVDMIVKTAPGQAKFIGGIILPGMRLMQASIIGAAANIGQIHGEWRDFPLNTQDAVHSGSLYALCGAVDNLLQILSEYCGHVVPCMLSGGDAAALLPVLQKHALAREYHLEENLVLQGLWYLEREAS